MTLCDPFARACHICKIVLIDVFVHSKLTNVWATESFLRVSQEQFSVASHFCITQN